MRSFAIVTVLVAFSAVAVAQSSGHFHHHDPAEHIDKIASKISTELAFTAAQQTSFDNLVTGLKTQIEAQHQQHHATMASIKQELGNNNVDFQKVANLAKTAVSERLTSTQIDSLIDQTTAFYQTLTPIQQQKAVQMLQQHFDHAPAPQQ